MNRRSPPYLHRYLQQQIAAALDWYRACDVCEETLANVKRDLDSVTAEACRRFQLDRMPFLLRARFEGAELVVSAITRDLS